MDYTVEKFKNGQIFEITRGNFNAQKNGLDFRFFDIEKKEEIYRGRRNGVRLEGDEMKDFLDFYKFCNDLSEKVDEELLKIKMEKERILDAEMSKSMGLHGYCKRCCSYCYGDCTA